MNIENLFCLYKENKNVKYENQNVNHTYVLDKFCSINVQIKILMDKLLILLNEMFMLCHSSKKTLFFKTLSRGC